jgi:hypothetical protein
MAANKKQSTEAAVREIRRRTRREFAPEERVRIVLDGLRGEQSIADLCRREGIACWGANNEASVGQVNVPAGLVNPSAIAAGDVHTCVLDDNGVTCWGENLWGQTTVPASLANRSSARVGSVMGWGQPCRSSRRGRDRGGYANSRPFRPEGVYARRSIHVDRKNKPRIRSAREYRICRIGLQRLARLGRGAPRGRSLEIVESRLEQSADGTLLETIDLHRPFEYRVRGTTDEEDPEIVLFQDACLLRFYATDPGGGDVIRNVLRISWPRRARVSAGYTR